MKFPEFYGTHRAITAFTRARQLFLSWANLTPSAPPILFFKATFESYFPIYAYVFQVVSFSSFPHQNFVCNFLIASKCHMPRTSLCPWTDHTNGTSMWCVVQITKLLITQSPPLPRPKYLPQHTVLQYPLRTFLVQCERPSFTPI